MKLFDLVKSRRARFDGDAVPETDALLATRRLKRDVREAGHVVYAFGLRPEGKDQVVVRGEVPDEATRIAVIDMLSSARWVKVVVDQLLVTQPEAPSDDDDDDEAPRFFLYTVQPSDTLTAIAKRLYGPEASVDGILEANRHHLLDPQRINCGQILRMPPLPFASDVSSESSSE